MRNVWRVVLGAGLVAGLCGGAAAQDVRIWAPTPVKVSPHKAPVAKTKVNVINVVVVTSRYDCLVSNDFGSDYRYGGCRGGYYNDMRYPF